MHAKLAVDLGNSETRIVVCFEDTQGQERKILSTIPAKYAIMRSEPTRYEQGSSNYSWDTSWVYRVNKQLIAGGLIVNTEFGTTCKEPTPLRKKYKQEATDYAIPIVLYRAYTIISEVTNIPVEELDVDFDISICMPPQDMEKGIKEMSEKLSKVKNIEFVRPELKKEVYIANSKLVEEAYMGYKTIEDQNGTTLVIDIGEGTTDLCLTYDGALNTESQFTMYVGGDKITQKLKQYIEEEYPIRALSNDSYRKIVRTGIYTLANGKTLDFHKELERAVDSVADKICEGIIKYLNRLDMSIDEVDRVLLLGGVLMENEANISMNTILREYLTDLFDNDHLFLELSNLSYETYSPEDGFGHYEGENPRTMNVIGASLSM